jgi:hypothetical protein
MLAAAAQMRPKAVGPYASVFWGWHQWLLTRANLLLTSEMYILAETGVANRHIAFAVTHAMQVEVTIKTHTHTRLIVKQHDG